MNPLLRSIYGALVGDAAGAPLEFYGGGPITPDVVAMALSMPGGGRLKVGPGQITDDGELTLTLWQSLHQPGMDMVWNILRGYADWYDSYPFDIGRTCSLAFETYSRLPNTGSYDLIQLEQEIASFNRTSEANGALMRATAIATWAVEQGETVEEAVGLARADARLSHPNPVCQDANALYVMAVYLLLQGRAPADVLQEVEAYVDRMQSSAITLSPSVVQWFREASTMNDLSAMNAAVNIGHVRWAFTMAFYFLRHPEISFEEALQTVLLKGGDTDTNAAIVGGMVATYQPIPDAMLAAVMSFDAPDAGRRRQGGHSGRMRPAAYCPKYVLKME